MDHVEKKLRRCFVLKEVEVELEDVKRGQIFRLEPGGVSDFVNVGSHEYSMAEEDAKLTHDTAIAMVKATNISFVESRHPRQLNFRS